MPVVDELLEPSASDLPEAAFDDPEDLAFIPAALRERFEIHSWRNAATVLTQRHMVAWNEIETIVGSFSLKKSHLLKTDDFGEEVAKGGGRKSLVAESIDAPFTAAGWTETLFITRISVEGKKPVKRPKQGKRGPMKSMETVLQTFHRVEFSAPTHKVDCFKDGVALEVEWNNKNPFFDRDLNNFRLLFDLRAVQVGVIVTRCDELDALFDALIGKKQARTRYGATTTRMSKLIPLLKGGGGGGCPVLVIGINQSSYDPTA